MGEGNQRSTITLVNDSEGVRGPGVPSGCKWLFLYRVAKYRQAGDFYTPDRDAVARLGEYTQPGKFCLPKVPGRQAGPPPPKTHFQNSLQKRTNKDINSLKYTIYNIYFIFICVNRLFSPEVSKLVSRFAGLPAFGPLCWHPTPPNSSVSSLPLPMYLSPVKTPLRITGAHCAPILNPHYTPFHLHHQQTIILTLSAPCAKNLSA